MHLCASTAEQLHRVARVTQAQPASPPKLWLRPPHVDVIEAHPLAAYVLIRRTVRWVWALMR